MVFLKGGNNEESKPYFKNDIIFVKCTHESYNLNRSLPWTILQRHTSVIWKMLVTVFFYLLKCVIIQSYHMSWILRKLPLYTLKWDEKVNMIWLTLSYYLPFMPSQEMTRNLKYLQDCLFKTFGLKEIGKILYLIWEL